MLENFPTCFQLKTSKQKQSQNPIIAKIQVKEGIISVDLNIFFQCTDFLSNIQKNESAENQVDAFIKLYNESVKKLKIKDVNSKIFLNIISGQQTKINFSSFFDIYKLSKNFNIQEILTYLQETCKMIKDKKIIISFLKEGQISKEEMDNFTRFLSFCHLDEMLSECIDDCFESLFFNPEFPINAIFRILRGCKSIDLIPASKLFELIMMSFDRNYRLLPFLDFYRLDTKQKLDFCKEFHDFIKKTKQLKDQFDQIEAKPSPNYLLENDLKLKEIKMKEMQVKIENLQTENDHLKKKTDQKLASDKSKVDEIAELKRSLEELQTENIQLKKKIYQNLASDKFTIDEITELKRNFEKLQIENDQLKKKIDYYKNKNASNISSKDSFELEKEMENLQTEKQYIKSRNDQNSTDTNLSDLLKSKIDENDNLQKNLYLLQKEKEQIDDKNRKLSDNLNELIIDFNKLEEQIKQLKAENQQLKNHQINDENPNPNRQHPTYMKHKSQSNDHKEPETNDHPHLTQKNYERIKIFNENKKIIKDGCYKANKNGILNPIKTDFEYSVAHTQTIKAEDHLTYDSKRKKCKQIDKSRIYFNIEVTHESTFAAAIRMRNLQHKKVCVLNFASATKPGGGVLNGRNAQEESLSRQSTLYFSLVEQKGFYEYNNKNYDSFGTDYMIYSPNVIILRDDNDVLIDPIKVSVISSVAVNYSELLQIYHNGEKDKKVYDVMKNRCRRILELCLSKGNDVIVLGAFGCGVFKNSPKVISNIFKELLIDEAFGIEFKKVVFAIMSKPNSSDDLFKVFESTFKYKYKTTA